MITPVAVPALSLTDDEDLPSTWSDGARETFEAVSGERPDLSAADNAALWHACALESAADALDAVAAAAGYVAKGSAGQVVAHPAAVEARLARTAAAAIMSRLAPPTGRMGSQFDSTRGRDAARARWAR